MANQQLRKHIKPTLTDKYRIWKIRRQLGNCGSGVYFEKNSAFMRYPHLISIGNNVIVKEGAKICPCNESASVSIGHNTTIGYHTFIFASASISIGNDCQIAPFVYLVDSDHAIAKEQLMNQQANLTAPIKIGNDVWIATGAKILRGVTIHDGAVIAAGAVVREDVQAYEIVGGIPAKHLGFRE
ncbi:acetyltransferase-like isoleucine patch superfamily enzyme [Catalinimonas alkaloidigena]|uniref:acyltransferase n=1 Tax=Catalinimonas alkaloidigena TaxID=1075417 RepID=UPI002405906E|nr:acyltransferase [Catalinimonas alkaloidigena]MDF9798017.1 acetyltransferase-like isoleucine patch superfamily enzyme [Catalinimonas alkaloidigena]